MEGEVAIGYLIDKFVTFSFDDSTNVLSPSDCHPFDKQCVWDRKISILNVKFPQIKCQSPRGFCLLCLK